MEDTVVSGRLHSGAYQVVKINNVIVHFTVPFLGKMRSVSVFIIIPIDLKIKSECRGLIIFHFHFLLKYGKINGKNNEY